MFSLIRRISHSVIPRPDRPWADDPTSNAPQKGRKRRLSSTDRDLDPDMEQMNKKKVRGESVASSVTDVAHDGSSTLLHETEGVKEVTEGVKEVEITEIMAPESIPLPAEEIDELDEPSSGDTPPPETENIESSTTETEPTTDVPVLNTGPEVADVPIIPEPVVPAPNDVETEKAVAVEGPSEEGSTLPLNGAAGTRRSARSKPKEDTSAKD
ncbi:hypothetical protein BDZ94DRAFT_1233309 [Collybia nuda]|uniref:Uncharacterized protein n=1 Tax=Collybia nuda TaxID=64659 RepID=A0A9P6CI33_9AGAR|nr:hypothetical protein BDZ94DRAFT_1233309 [Collybia nuda]